MIVNLYSGPALEPVTLDQLKTHLGISSGTIPTDMTPYTCIASGSHAVVTSYSLLGTAVDVLGKTAVVYLTPVNNGTNGTVDVKIQECDTEGGTWTDWATGAFTQVTEATDTTIQEKAYTGTKRYIRTAAKTLVAACEFGTSVMVWEPNVSEDDMLNELITAGRLAVEHDTNRRLVTQTWDYYPQSWPDGDRIKIPYGNLQNAEGMAPVVTYKDSDGTETTMTVTTDYLVLTNGDQCGFIVLPESGTWPSVTLYPSNPIKIRFTCGYGAAASDVPVTAKQAIKRWCANNYMNRGDNVLGQTVSYDRTYDNMCNLVGRLRDLDFL